MHIKIEAVKLDSTTVKVHPDGMGALKKTDPGHRKIPRRMDHQDSSGCRGCSNGHNLCSLAGPSLRRCPRPRTAGRHRTAARAPASHHGRRLRGRQNPPTGSGLWLHPGHSAPSNRLQPWQYDKAMYRKRNEIERLFRRLKGFRRIFSRFDKLDVVFLAFLNFALIVEALR